MPDTFTETEVRQAIAEGDSFLEWRAKYKQAERDAMAKSGQAMSDGSYPIKDADDLSRAIKAVGRGGASHNAIRKHIMAQAKALNLTSQIPDNWNADGSLKEQNAAKPKCDLCDGSGKIRAGKRDCPKCGGTGTMPDGTTPDASNGQQNAAPLNFEQRKALAVDLKGVMEHREFSVADMEIREVGSGSLRMSGYASVTDTPYEVAGFNETIKRGAFKRTLGEDPDVQLLVNHEGLPLARTKSGTLRLTEDDRGLKVDADLDPERTDVQNLVRAMNRRDIDQMSFAFQCTDGDWNDDYTERTIRAVSIHRGDVSIVNQGASPTTSASVR